MSHIKPLGAAPRSERQPGQAEPAAEGGADLAVAAGWQAPTNVDAFADHYRYVPNPMYLTVVAATISQAPAPG